MLEACKTRPTVVVPQLAGLLLGRKPYHLGKAGELEKLLFADVHTKDIVGDRYRELFGENYGEALRLVTEEEIDTSRFTDEDRRLFETAREEARRLSKAIRKEEQEKERIRKADQTMVRVRSGSGARSSGWPPPGS
jgi:hypothetical protein